MRYNCLEYKSPVEDDHCYYHYCSTETFYNIIKSKKIRMFNLLEMNDPSELSILKFDIYEKIIKLLGSESEKIFLLLNGRKISLKDCMYLDTMKPNGYGYGNYNINLAFCLSKTKESLSQWRLYGDNGYGFCLGFDAVPFLVNGFQSGPFSIATIRYVDDFEKEVEGLAKNAIETIKKLYATNDNDRLLQYWQQDIQSMFIEASFKFKHSAYASEDEIRLVYKKKIPIEINQQNSVDDYEDLIPVLRKGTVSVCKEIDLNVLGLKSIITGPLNNSTKSAVNLLLRENGVNIDPDNIYHSTIPYRT